MLDQKSLFRCFIAVLVVIAIIAAAVIATSIQNEYEENTVSQLPPTSRIRETFVNLHQKMKINAPMVFQRQKLSVPCNCYPYAGCTYPSRQANAMNLQTGKRSKVVGRYDQSVECRPELVYKDCNLFQDCIQGKCVAKAKKAKKTRKTS